VMFERLVAPYFIVTFTEVACHKFILVYISASVFV